MQKVILRLITWSNLDWLLLLVNLADGIFYIYGSSAGWGDPAQEAMGLHSGEPVVWLIGIVPSVIFALWVDVPWLIAILWWRRWRSGIFGIISVLIWLIAIRIDFAHHGT